MKAGKSPESAMNTCYFYNRLQGDDAMFVTYQYSDKGENIVPRNELDEAIPLLG